MKKLPNLTELKECPYCGSETFLIYNRVSGIVPYYERFDGGEADNTHMWSHVDIKSQISVYCGLCKEKIAKNNR